MKYYVKYKIMTYEQVTPLTSLKFAELVVRAGFPPGIVNILPGSGMLNTLDHASSQKQCNIGT